MIIIIADLLKEIMLKEEKVNEDFIKEENITHGTTIGNMYESLSKSILNKAIPGDGDIKIVSGFISDGLGEKTGQVDCMLVRGEGKKIPGDGDDYIYHIKDVLCVLEIKKNLYFNDLDNACKKLQQVSSRYLNYIFNNNDDDKELDLQMSYDAFELITSIKAPNWFDRKILSPEILYIYETIVHSQLCPVTIVHGYNGYKKESGLRDAFIKFIEESDKKTFNRVFDFPDLITANGFSITKSNGFPYSIKMIGERWPVFLSSPSNPLLIMIELIWTKLSYEQKVKMPWGDGQKSEAFNLFLDFVIKKVNGRTQIEISPINITDDELKTNDVLIDWKPVILTDEQYNILLKLSSLNGEGLSFDDNFIKSVSISYDLDDFVNQLLKTNLFVKTADKLYLSKESISVVGRCDENGDPQWYAGDSSSVPFQKWLENNIA